MTFAECVVLTVLNVSLYVITDGTAEWYPPGESTFGMWARAQAVMIVITLYFAFEKNRLVVQSLINKCLGEAPAVVKSNNLELDRQL